MWTAQFFSQAAWTILCRDHSVILNWICMWKRQICFRGIYPARNTIHILNHPCRMLLEFGSCTWKIICSLTGHLKEQILEMISTAFARQHLEIQISAPACPFRPLKMFPFILHAVCAMFLIFADALQILRDDVQRDSTWNCDMWCIIRRRTGCPADCVYPCNHPSPHPYSKWRTQPTFTLVTDFLSVLDCNLQIFAWVVKWANTTVLERCVL